MQDEKEHRELMLGKKNTLSVTKGPERRKGKSSIRICSAISPKRKEEGGREHRETDTHTYTNRSGPSLCFSSRKLSLAPPVHKV